VIAKDLSRMRVNASISESDIGRIAAGQPVTFTVDAYPGEIFIGTVTQVRLEPVVESNVVSYVTIIDVPNPDQKLKPGMTASVSVEIARSEDVLRIPNSALRFRPPAGVAPQAAAGSQQPTVWVLREDALQPVRVQTGLSNATATAVVEGDLRPNDHVVVGQAVAGAVAPSQSPFMPTGRRGGGGSRR
jgi:HlyD family secretion protein